MPADIPEPVTYVGSVAAAIAAIAAAVRKAVVPLIRGLHALARAQQDIIDGAQLAKRELSANHGTSIKDRIDQAARDADAARTKAARLEDKVERIEARVDEIADESR